MLDPESLGLLGYTLLALFDELDEPNRFPTMAVAVDTMLDVLFREESSAENTWIVPWLLEATSRLESGLKYKLWVKVKVLNRSIFILYVSVLITSYLKLME